jgi:mersacidin/lichenicidin family type 2 lantibiotic
MYYAPFDQEVKMAIDIRRAWKDPEYRKSLSAEELASLPPNPAGDAEVPDDDLERVSGGAATAPPKTEGESLLWCPAPTQPQTNCCQVSKDICCLSK